MKKILMTRLYNSYSLHFFLLSIKKGPADATIKNLKSVCYIFMFGNLFQKARGVCTFKAIPVTIVVGEEWL